MSPDLAALGIDEAQLVKMRPGATYEPILLPRWFPLERARLVGPGIEKDCLALCAWFPGDALTAGEQPPHWEFQSPWSDFQGLDYDDERVLWADASLFDLRSRAQVLYGPTLLAPATYRSAWGPDADAEVPQWAELPLLVVTAA